MYPKFLLHITPVSYAGIPSRPACHITLVPPHQLAQVTSARATRGDSFTKKPLSRPLSTAAV